MKNKVWRNQTVNDRNDSFVLIFIEIFYNGFVVFCFLLYDAMAILTGWGYRQNNLKKFILFVFNTGKPV
jgi:hypothetical protein